ncbi:DUF3139 domain-containing protein [Alkalihalobacterium bogoriense]|uniref:DUF3139 domain-containing protein n=1 Tax=Alkalihalobacterium bogoriense TaxID=246272 RepID=UPI000688A0AA|nr:DUF3139 domain-containing protein [Alkalihalobacterium bogoriense]
MKLYVKRYFLEVLFFSIIGLVLLTFFIMVYLINNGNPYENYIITTYVPTYLEEQGYEEGQIRKQHPATPKHPINKSVYQTQYNVVFDDEPHITYVFGVTRKGKEVVQFCEKEINAQVMTDFTTKDTKHAEKECIGYLENRD